MDANQERKQRGQAKSSSAPADKPLSTGTRSILMLTLFVDVVAIALYAFFGTGDEVTCGSGISANVCYLPGVDWLGYAMMLAFALTVVCFMLLSPDKK
jgi:hypothetical protein